MAKFEDALRAALKANEVGESGNPYALSFAGVGGSGASFGVFQGDTAVNGTALATLQSALAAAKVPVDQIGRILAIVREPCTANAFGTRNPRLALCNAALDCPAGRALVDALDEITFATVQRRIDMVDQTAAKASVPLDDAARLAAGLWINMTGAPTTLLNFIAAQHAPVTLDVMTKYLTDTRFFMLHPQNLAHFEASVQTGLNVLANP